MRFWFIIAAIFLSTAGVCQKTSGNDRINDDSTRTVYARKATLLSAIIPGAGQIYNRKYWKAPLIYGGAAAFIYFVNLNNTYYQKYRDLYEQKVDGTADPIWDQVNKESIRREREYWRRNRDLNYIGLGVLYFLQVIDANVDAHLYEYDISDDLTFRYEPILHQPVRNPVSLKTSNTLGLKLSLNF